MDEAIIRELISRIENLERSMLRINAAGMKIPAIGCLVGRNDPDGTQYQSVASGVFAAVALTTAAFDYVPTGLQPHYTAGNNYITIRVSGIYLVAARVNWWSFSASGRVIVGAGTSTYPTIIGAQAVYNPSGITPALSVAGIRYLSSGSRISIYVRQETGTTQSLASYAPAAHVPYLAVVLLSTP